MFAQIPYIVDIVTVVVIIDTILVWWCWRCCRRLEACCKKAEEAWDGVDALTKWAQDLELNKVLKCLTLATGCKGDDPSWPPPDPGDFPSR